MGAYNSGSGNAPTPNCTPSGLSTVTVVVLRPTKLSPIPTLYLKGYEPDDTETRQVRGVLKRRSIEEVGCVNTPFKKRKVNQSALLKENTASVPENLQPDTTNSGSVPCPTPVPSQPTLSSGTKKKVPTGSICTNDDAKVPRSLKKKMSWDMIKGRKRLVKFYTRCPTAEVFMFIVDHVRPKHKKTAILSWFIIHYNNTQEIPNKPCHSILSTKTWETSCVVFRR
ncbi:Hypothetical predicted protein [Paramuricea clavata]|uniref:Uncharacterized protein n=1 Tax=Paramuricea clavata TaxID=317549 RepID=A0A7D9E4A5_PARCT|nr:Hypothetical predicted protein [Paramuricea clavata]